MTATLDHPSSEATTVTVTVTPVAPAMADDYTLSANLELTIPASATESEGVVTITAANNDVDAPDKTVTVSATATNDRGVTAPQAVTLTITDDDLVELSVDDVSVAEGDSGSTTMQFTVTLDPAAKGEVTVDWATADGTATAGTDYTSGSGSLTFGVGETSKTVTVTVTGDTVDEPNETFTVTLSSAVGATLVKAVGTGTITDDDDAPTVSVSDATAVEAADLVFPVSLSHASSRQITVDYAITPDTATSADYRGTTSGTVTFAAGVTTGSITLDLVDDTADEPDETVTVTLSNPLPSGAATIGTATATGTITDNDVPVVTVAAETGTVREGRDVVFILTRTGLVTDELVVTFTVTGGEAVLSDEPPTEATFGAGASTVRVPLATDADEVEDPDATVALTLADGDAYDLGTSFAATVTVSDSADLDVGKPVVTVAAETGTVKEGEDAAFILTRTKDPSDELVVTFTVTGGGAVLSEELPTEVTFGAGASTARVPLGTENDHTHEADAALTLTLTDGDAYDLGTPSAATVTVQDDDDPPPDLSIDDVSVAEGGSGDSATMRFTVTLNPAATGEVTVDWATADGTAEAGTDYTSGSGSLTFGAGETSKTVTVTVTGDDVDEPNETFTVALSNASGASLGKAVGTGTITDDDDAPTVTLVLTPASITEAAGQSTVTARLDHRSSEETTVTVSAAPESPAVAGDYTLSTDRVLTIAAGATTSTGAVTITAVDNAVDAPHKTVTVSATAENTQGITAPQDVTLTIRDDENVAPTGAPTIDDTTPVVGETLTVGTSGIGDSDGLTGATYAYRWVRVASGGAETEVGTGATYTVVAADVGATLKVEASFTDDGGAEETVESAATATVEAVPLPVVTVVSDGDVTEGSPALFTLTRTGDPAQTLDVDYEVAATGDFGVTTGASTATFLADSATAQVSVATTGDDTHEAHGSVTLTLTADTGVDPAYLLGAPAEATAAVEDDDNAAPTGAPTIDDTTPVVGQTLTADPSGIADADGLTGATFTWRWLRVASGGTETQVGTGSSYTVVAGDMGATLKVEASFTDDGGTAETVESAATSAVAEYTITVASPRVTEGDDGSALLDFALTRSETGQRVEIGWRVATEGTARPVTDFDGPMEGTLVLRSNTRSRSVYLQVIPDIVDESDETVVLEFFSVAGTPEGVTFPATVTGTIVDDDTATLSIAPSSVDEGDSGTRELVFTVSLDLQSDREVTVEYDVGGTAESGADYEAPTPVLVTFPALSWEPQRIVFRVLGDTDAERHETVAVELRDPSGGAELGTAKAEGVIRNDDGPLLSVDPPEVGRGRFDGRASAAHVPGDAVGAVGYGRYGGLPGGHRGGHGDGGRRFSEQVRDGDDQERSDRCGGEGGGQSRTTEFELDETVVMVFENPEGAVLEAGSGRVTGTIRNDDLPRVTVAADAGTVTEGEAAAFRLRRPDVDTSEALVVSFTVADPGGVLAGTAPVTATIAAGETEETVSAWTRWTTGSTRRTAR